MANSFNLPNFSEIQQETSTAFLDKAAGNKLSSVQQEFINDSSYMPSERFDSKWGEGSYAQALNQMAQSSRLARDKSIGRKTSLFSADTLRNIISGATTGIASSGAYVAEKVGNKELAESLSDSTNDITDLFEKYASFEQKAADRAFSLENAIKKAESQRQYERDIFNGVPQEEALRAREVRDYHNSVVSSFETGQYAKALSQGTGSILSSVLLTRGVGGLVSNVGKAASVSASTAFKAKDAFHLSSPRVQKALDTLSWMAVSGAQEAGGVLTEHLNEVTNLPDEAFSNSDQFNFRKAEYIKAGMSEEEASFQAKKDVAHLIANEAADKQFAITTPLNVLTSGLAKPFTMGGKRLSTFIGEALSEPVEEGIAEGSGKYFGNVAKQKYLDPSQDIYEGIGSAVAEGVVGGLGIGATRVPGTAIGTVADAITAGHNYYQNKQAEALPETLKEGSSEPIETETDFQVGNVTTQITSDTNSTFLYSDKGLIQEQSDKEATSNTWYKAYFVDESSPISQELTSEEGKKSLESFAEKTINDDGTIQVKESKDSEWRPLKRSDINKNVTIGSSEDTIVSLPKNSSPQQGNSILKVSLGENGNIQSISSAGKLNSISPIQVGNQEELVKSIAPKVQEKVGSIFTDSLESAPFTASSYEKSPIPGTQLIHGSDEGIYLSDGKGYVTIASPEESSYIDSLSDEDYVKELVSRIKQKAVGQLFTLQISDKETTINVLGNSYQFNGKTYDLSPETQQVFANPNATLQEKAKALESEFTGSNFTVTPEGVTSRDAYDLNPEEAEKLGKYTEDGEVKDYDREEVKQSWVNKFKEKFHKLVDYFIPVRRPTHLWNSDKSPIEVVQEVLQSKESLEKFLKANNFTNATRLANSLWNDKEKLIKEVVSMLSKDGIFMKKFQAQIDAGFFKMPENCPESIKEAFYDKDGNPNEKLLEIASIAALHWTAILSAYKHQLNEEELERLRIDPDLLESKFDTTGGVVTSVALQNLATSIRKFTGVAINNKVPQNEAERVFGYIATKTAGALIKSNVIETFEVTYTARERNKETGKFEVVEKKLQMMKPTKDFDKLFRPKSGILLSIIDPTYSNSFHLEPPPVKETVAHSSERITKTQRRVLEIANSKPAKINKLFVQFLAAIGGEEGLAEILEENAKEAYRHTKSFKDYQSKQGREISRRLAFDLIREILSSDTEMSVEEFKVYFSNIILKNSRVMQEGAATYQSNKLVRQILNYTDGKKHDLTDKKNFESWKLILAQNLGVKVNAILFKNYEEKIDAALKWMQERVYEPEYVNLLKDIKNIDARTILNGESGSKEIRQSFKNLLDAFNKAHKDLGLSLKKEEGFNALLEMLRYAEATKESKEKSEDLKAFESHIFLEIDGINDGPSFINRLFGVGMGSFSSQFFTNNAKTGIYFGVMLTSQEAMNNPEVAKFLFGEEQGKDFHAEVAKEKITGYFLQRFLDFKKAAKDKDIKGLKSDTAIEAEIALEVIKNTLTFFKSLGWIDTKGKSIKEIIDNLDKIPSNPEEYPFTFDREISKKLVTIIPYGSQPKGSTEQVLQLGLETFYENMSKCFEEVALGKKPSQISMNGVSFEEAMNSLKNLFGFEFSDGTFSKYKGKLEDLAFSFDSKLPTKDQIEDTHWKLSKHNSSGLLENKDDPFAIDVRNFYIKALGLDHLANLLVPIFGEPAQAAVNEVLTAKGMTGALYPTVISGLLTFVKTAVQNLYNSEKPLNSLSKNERFKIEKEMQAVGPNYQFSGGAKVVVEKTSYANENEVLYTDPETGLEYRSSQSFVTSSGVSGGSLTTQAAGDATTMMELEELLNNLGILVGSVHDGFYVGMGNENTVGNAANKASDLAQRQRILKSIRKQVDKAGKFITKKKWSTKDDPIEAIKDVLVKIAQGKLLNGKNAGEDVKQISKNMQYELLRYLDQVKESFAFESSFFKQRDARLHAPKKPIKEDAENVESEVRSALDTFFSKFDAVLLTEEINQQVLDDMPRTIQHMSGAHDQSATYSVGKVLEFAEALKVLNKVNEEMKKLNLPTFKTWGDLWSAFANLRAKILYDAKATELSKAKREAFEQLNGLDKGNSGTRNELPEEVYSLMTAHFGKTNEEPVKNKSDFSSRNLDKSAVAHAFNTISKKVKHPGIYNKFKDVIVKLLPDNLPITIVSSKAALPKEVRARFSNSKQLGVYIVSNGKPQIFIVSENGKLDTSDLGVAQTLVHEAVHAVISATIALYKQDPKRVPPAQRNALKNLEKLLDSFMKEVPSIQSDVIQELRNILENSSSMAEKLDESIAYVMSNVEIFNTLANHKFSDLDKHKANFKRLIKNIAKTIWSFLSNLFGVTENSALDNYFQKFFKELDSTIPEELNFISLYGANTLVVLGSNLKNPKGTKTRESDSAVQDLIRSALVLPSADRTIRDITFSLESLRDTPMEFVAKASDLFIKASGWYKAMTSTGTLKQLDTFTERRRKISNEKIIIENNKLSNYQGALANALRNLVPEDKLDQTVNTITMLQTQGFVPPMVAEALNEMFINTRKQLDAHFMVDKNTAIEEDYKISEGIYKLLFKTDLINKADRPEVLNPQFQNAAIFYALAANVPAFAEAVGNLKINAPKLPSFKDMVNPFNLKEGFEKISIALMDNWKHLKFGETSSGEIVHLIDNGKGEPGHPTLTKVAQAIDSVFHTVDKSIATVLLAPWIFFKNKNAKNLSESWKEVLESPVATHGFLMNRFRDFANNHCNVFMSGLIKELYGRTPSNTGVEVFLKKIKGFFDKDRKINLEFLTNKLISEFKNTKVDSKFRQLLHRVIGRSEIVHLSLDEAQKVLTDKKELLNKINSLEGDIRDQYIESTKYMDKALQLAKYLAGTGEAGHNLLTNGDAIGMLFGEPEAKSFRTDITHKAIHKINRLITLYYLRETMSDTDFVKFAEVYSKDSQAINNVIEQLNSAYTREQERSYENFPEDVNKLYIYNRVHGFLPKGGNARGHYAIVPKSEAHNYWKKGYEILGNYQDSVKGTPMVRVYTQWPHEREAQEGIFQTITETAVGWEVQRKTRGEATGTKIIEPSIVSDLQTNYFTKQVDNVIPIYTTSGALLGFERAIPMSDRNKINENTDLFSAIAQWNVRQTREQEAKNINAEAVDMLYQDWENASEEQKRKQFVDIFNTKDPAIKAAVQRLPGDLVKDIKKKFGGEICWVRKDVVWSYIGYHRMSITDVWDNTTIFPNALENTIAKILDLIFFNGRGRFYAGNIETVLMGAVTWVRDTIIVRSGIVPIVNALANVLVLHFSLGIPLTKLYQLYKENYNLTMKYNHLTKKKMDLIYQKNLITPVFSDPDHPNNVRRNEIQSEINDIESIYKNSPIYRLIKEGEYSTISAVGTTYEEIDIGKQKISDWLESRTNKFGEDSTARTAVSEILMNKSSTGYQLAADFVNLGDWLAKTVAYRYLTEGDNPRGLRLNHDEARNIASILFVDFDQFVSRERDWMNRIGLTWFMTYKYRMVPAALLGVLLNPSRLILGTALSNWTGLGTPFNENLIAKFLSGELGYSVGYEMLWSGATMHPISTILNTVR